MNRKMKSNPCIREKKCLSTLANIYLVTMFVSQLLSYRFVTIGSMLTVASVFVIPISYSVSDLIAEQYGYDAVRLTIWRTLPILFFASFLLFIAQELPASAKYSRYTESYYAVFHPALRVYFSNLIAIIFGMFLNSFIIIKWKLLVNGRIFFIRSFFSSIAGEFIFTTIVVFLVQFGISSWKDSCEMILISFSIKAFFTVISAFIGAFVKPIIGYIDGYNAFVETASYNPFKFTEQGPELAKENQFT